jgi:prolyl-tRNA editing enzyme YbaK/EbsC (Cys-tRNA(Pro) deacylase)
MADSPADGDVLITTEGGRHLLSVVPHPHRLSMSEYAAALQIAKRWAASHKVAVWRTDDGVVTKLQLD